VARRRRGAGIRTVLFEPFALSLSKGITGMSKLELRKVGVQSGRFVARTEPFWRWPCNPKLPVTSKNGHARCGANAAIKTVAQIVASVAD
jgi:hypothetical protein